MVQSNGQVIATLPTAEVVKLPNPDGPNALATGWEFPLFKKTDAANSGENPVSNDPLSVDLVLDGTDNIFLLVDDRNSLLTGADGFVFGWSGTGSVLNWAVNGMLKLQSNLRTVAFYHVPALMGPSASLGFSRMFAGIASALSFRGAAIVSTDPSCQTDNTSCPVLFPGSLPKNTDCCLQSPGIDDDSWGTVTGSAYLDGTGMLGLLAHSLAASGPAMAAFKEDGSPAWPTPTPVQFISHVNQPAPTIDPYTKNVYWVGVAAASPGNQKNVLYCIQGASGSPCAGYTASGIPLVVSKAIPDPECVWCSLIISPPLLQ